MATDRVVYVMQGCRQMAQVVKCVGLSMCAHDTPRLGQLTVMGIKGSWS